MRPADIAEMYGNKWRLHYEQYLLTLATQLFKWKGLPNSVDARYIEMILHTRGQLAFYKDPLQGYIAVGGSQSGAVNHYELPLAFQATAPNYNKYLKLYTYQKTIDDTLAVLIRNNDFSQPTTETIFLFAEELSQLKVTQRINVLTARAPFAFRTTSANELSVKNLFNDIQRGAPAILVDKSLNLDDIQVLDLKTPLILDILNTHRISLWNEIMTFLGIDNANIEKKERLITDEVTANSDQVSNSSNTMLKTRQDAAEIINLLHPELNVTVEVREDVIDKFRKEVERNGMVYNATEGNN